MIWESHLGNQNGLSHRCYPPAYGKLIGILFFKEPLAGYLTGALVIFGAYLCFFDTGQPSARYQVDTTSMSDYEITARA